uniref:hypothetical protein n=1 Tax=Gelidibacter japonicus TaxID=1962232 RepID=UPI003A8F7F1C
GLGNFISQLTGLESNTTYYVRAYATNTVGTAYGNQLTFTTLGSGNVSPAFNPVPADGTTNIPLNGTLSFTPGNNTPANATFKLYFGTNQNPTTSFNLGTSTSFNYNNLQENTNYYWKVETISNTNQILATSSIWNFKTLLNSGGGTYVGDVFLSNQQEVDDFGANNYSVIIGNLLIGAYNVDLDFSSLIYLTEIQGELAFDCKFCSSLQGFNNLTSLNSLTLRRFENLPNFEGLNGLTNVEGNVLIGGDFFNKNLNLYSLDGLENLTTVGGYVHVQGNDQLQDLDGFSGLQNVEGEYLRVRANFNLTDLCGLTNIVVSGGIAGYYSVYENLYNPTEQDIIDGNCSQ